VRLCWSLAWKMSYSSFRSHVTKKEIFQSTTPALSAEQTSKTDSSPHYVPWLTDRSTKISKNLRFDYGITAGMCKISVRRSVFLRAVLIAGGGSLRNWALSRNSLHHSLVALEYHMSSPDSCRGPLESSLRTLVSSLTKFAFGCHATRSSL